VCVLGRGVNTQSGLFTTAPAANPTKSGSS
jgi:hypothetical protein